MTPQTPVTNVPDPGGIMCVISQGELFQLRAMLDSCHAVLHQIAAYQQQAMARFEMEGGHAVVPTQCAMAMTALSHVFGVEYRPASAEEMREAAGLPEVPPTAGPEPVPQPTPEEAPPRRAWKPSVIAGGKS